MKNRKGFTLVELLAVIIILGIIMVIIIPKVTTTIKDSKQKTYESSARALEREAENFYLMKKSKQEQFSGCTYNFTTNTNTCDGYDFKGEKPTSGGIKISSDGKSAFGLKFDDYCYSKGYNDDEITAIKTDDCSIPKQIGDEITISGEHFYVIDSNAYETKLLAKYNINSGPNKNDELPENRQDESLTNVADSTDNDYGTINFDATWVTYSLSDTCPEPNDATYLKAEYGSTYPAYIYDENNAAYTYLEAYKTILGNVKEVKLPSLEEIEALGCNTSNCDNTYSWVRSTNYWLGTAKNNYDMYAILDNFGSVASSSTYYSCGYSPGVPIGSPGIRPVVIVNTSNI